jgi:4-carboxymuconolactone decarboxylase
MKPERTITDTTSSTPDDYAKALETAERMLGFRLASYLGHGKGKPANAADFERIATMHAFGDTWPRTEHLDAPTRAPRYQ